MTAAMEYARFAGWLLALLSLGLIPVGASRWARVAHPRRRYMIIGICVGAIAAPFSMGLYGTFFIPVLGLVPGMIGLVLAMLHEAPGFYLAITLKLLPRGVVVHGVQNLYLDVLNGLVWGAFYGIVGAFVDRWRAAPSNPTLQPTGVVGS